MLPTPVMALYGGKCEQFTFSVDPWAGIRVECFGVKNE